MLLWQQQKESLGSRIEPITSVMSVQCFGMMIFNLILSAQWLFLKNSSFFAGQLWTDNKF